MVDADVAIAEVDPAVVAAPAIGVDDGARVGPAADDALEGGLRAVRDDLGIDVALPLEDAAGCWTGPTCRSILLARRRPGRCAQVIASWKPAH